MAHNLDIKKASTTDIDLIKDKLEEIIRWSEKNKNRNGYFAALYKKITLMVKDAVEKEAFEDNARMVSFVLTFADYYIDAHQKFRENRLEKSSPWHTVFQKGWRKHSIVQHLLMGVNVHINYDLANTCNDISPGPSIIYLSHDFVKINEILSSSISQIEKEIFTLSPILSIASRLIPKLERKVLNFSVTVARSRSWESACQQAASDEEGKQKVKQAAMATAEELTGKILNAGPFANILIFFISMFELKSIRENLRVLNEKAEV